MTVKSKEMTTLMELMEIMVVIVVMAVKLWKAVVCRGVFPDPIFMRSIGFLYSKIVYAFLQYPMITHCNAEAHHVIMQQVGSPASNKLEYN